MSVYNPVNCKPGDELSYKTSVNASAFRASFSVKKVLEPFASFWLADKSMDDKKTRDG